VALRTSGRDLDRQVGIVGLHVSRKFDGRDLRRSQRPLPRVHADAVAGEIAAGPQLAGIRVGHDDDRLIVNGSRRGFADRLLRRDHTGPLAAGTVDADADVPPVAAEITERPWTGRASPATSQEGQRRANEADSDRQRQTFQQHRIASNHGPVNDALVFVIMQAARAQRRQ